MPVPFGAPLLPEDAVGAEGMEAEEVAGGVLSAVGTGVAGAESGVVLAGVIGGGVLVSVSVEGFEEAAWVCI